MNKFSRKRKQFFMFFIDILIFFASIPLTLFIRKFEFPSITLILTHTVTFLPMITLWLIMMYGSNMYSLEKQFNATVIFIKMLVFAIVSLLFGFALFYLVWRNTIAPKTVLIIYVSVAFLLVLLWRYAYFYFFGIKKKHPRLIFIGHTDTVDSLLKETEHYLFLSFKPLALFDSAACSYSNIPCFKDPKEFISFLSDKNFEYCVLSGEREYPHEIRQFLFELLGKGVVFFNLLNFYEIVNRKIPLSSVTDNWLLTSIDASSKPLFDIPKRFIDILLAFLILIITLPFWPIVALGIKLESKGPVFFKQTRIGRRNKFFTLYKFRTMKVEQNTFAPTSKNDLRITPMGNFLRKSRIDEIPQILNVIKGDMTFVGPRPERPELATDLEKAIPYYNQRHIVKPGLTGWDQVSGEYHSPSVEDTYKKLQLDLYYIKNRSILLDISILFKTVATVLKRSGR